MTDEGIALLVGDKLCVAYDMNGKPGISVLEPDGPNTLTLFEYLGGTVAGLDGISQGVGGVADHVHLLVGLKATHCLSDFMRELKKASSIWVHDEIGLKTFAWQEGYAAFSVSPPARPSVQKYIARQPQHHRKVPYRSELITLLRRAGIEYDERYLD